MARDVSTTINAWSYNLSEEMQQVFVQTGNVIPENSIEITAPRITLASARVLPLKKFEIKIEANAHLTTDGYRNTLIKSNTISIDPCLGLQVGYQNTVFLRGGINNFQEVEGAGQKNLVMQPNFGVGVRVFGTYINYALTNVGESVGLLSHVFSLKVHFNPRR